VGINKETVFHTPDEPEGPFKELIPPFQIENTLLSNPSLWVKSKFKRAADKK